MKLTESEKFKINLVNNLNQQRLKGINCDIEIDCSFNTNKIFTHSIILNLFSDVLKSFIEDKIRMTTSMSICKILFPEEINFVKTNCFDCMKEVINYLYAGEINVDPNHEVHVKNIVFNLKINNLIQLLFPSTKSWSGSGTDQHYFSQNTNAEPLSVANSHSSNVHIQTFPEPNKVNVDTTKHFIQSPLKKRLKFTNTQEMSYSNPIPNAKEVEGKEHIHSDGLHLLLSILEEENKKELLASSNNTIPILSEPEQQITPSNELDNTKQVIVENSIEDENLKENKESSIIYQALVSKKQTHDQISIESIENPTINIDKEHEPNMGCKPKNTIKQRKTRADKIKENNMKKKSGSLKKKGDEDKVIGVQDGFMCKKCKMFFDNLSSLQEHMQSTHSKKLRCISCNFMTIKIRSFIEHLILSRHEGTICSICHFQTSTNDELHKHIVMHKANLPRPFFCNNCDKTFPTRRSWSVHLPVHSNETQFLCAVCSKGFKWSQGLENHMSTHVNEKLYLCSQCDFQTANRAYLAKHTLTHVNKREVCPYEECKHREIRKENLKAHLLTHSKVKRFQCELCGKSFAQARNLDRHLESVHNPDTVELVCNQCSYVTIRLDKLKDHFKSRHKAYDYTQYVEQIKENIKTKSTTGAKVNRHLLSNTGPGWGMPDATAAHSRSVPLGSSNHSNASILTLPVFNQEGIFRVNSLEANSHLPIIMNVNKMTPNQTICVPKKFASNVRKPRTQGSKQSNAKTRDRKSAPSVQSISPTIVTKQNGSGPRKILPLINVAKPQPTLPSKAGPLLTNTPILLIISNTPKNQILTNASQLNIGKPKQLLLSSGKVLQVSNPSLNINTRLVSNVNSSGADTGRETKDSVATVQYTETPSNVDTRTNVTEYNAGSTSQYEGNKGHGNEPDGNSTVNSDTPKLASTVFQPPSQRPPSSSDPSTSSSDTFTPATSSTDSFGSTTASNNTFAPDTPTTNSFQPPTPSSNTFPPDTSATNSFPPPSSTNTFPPPNCFDVLDESTGELLLLSSKHIHNPLLDEATGELSVFEIPSSFINYIENITSSEYDNILGPELTGGNDDFNQDDLNEFSYHDETFQFLLNEERVSQWSDNKHAAIILDELTGELNLTTK